MKTFTVIGMTLMGFLAITPACRLAAQSRSVATVQEADTFTVRVDPALHPFEFHTSIITDQSPTGSVGGGNYPALSIVILDSVSWDTIQALTAYPELPPGETCLPRMVDANFDGYPDIEYLTMRGATGNEIFAYELYDPAVHHYRSDSLPGWTICNPMFDSRNKLVHTWTKCGGWCYTFDSYTVDHDTLRLTGFLSLEPASPADEKEEYHCKRVRVIDGKETILKEWNVGREVFKELEVGYWPYFVGPK